MDHFDSKSELNSDQNILDNLTKAIRIRARRLVRTLLSIFGFLFSLTVNAQHTPIGFWQKKAVSGGTLPVFRSSKTAVCSPGSCGTISVTKPTGTASGDLLIAAIFVQSNTNTVTPPSGYTQIDSYESATNSNYRMSYWYKIAGSSEPASYSFTINGTNVWIGLDLVAFYSVNTTTPIDSSALSVKKGASSTATANTVTTTSDNSMIYMHISSYNNGSTYATPSGMTSTGAWTGGPSFYISMPTVGTTGTYSSSINQSEVWITKIITINPAP